MDAEVKDNPVMHRLELSLSGDALAVSYYKEKDGRVILLHTEVPQPPSSNNSYAHLQDRFFARARRQCLGAEPDSHQPTSGDFDAG